MHCWDHDGVVGFSSCLLHTNVKVVQLSISVTLCSYASPVIESNVRQDSQTRVADVEPATEAGASRDAEGSRGSRGYRKSSGSAKLSC